MICMVLKHAKHFGLGNLNQFLLDFGFEIVTIEPTEKNLQTIDILTPDLVILLGAPFSVLDKDSYFPFIKQELDLIKKRIDEDMPLLGICLGSQLIAQALGASVKHGFVPEYGWKQVDVVSLVPKSFYAFQDIHVMHWHQDTFSLPKGATLIASTDKYIQAYSYGKNILATQFHFEVNEETLEDWYKHEISDIKSLHIELSKLREENKLYCQKLEQSAKKFFYGWLQEIGLNKQKSVLDFDLKLQISGEFTVSVYSTFKRPTKDLVHANTDNTKQPKSKL